MDKEFLAYLVLILTIIGGLTGFITFLLIKYKNRKKKVISGTIQSICDGNVSVFFDKDNNVTIIPYAKDKYGVGRAVEKPHILKTPYRAQELGCWVRKLMAVCRNGKPCSNEQLMIMLNFPGWKEFTVGKRNISIHYQREYGVVLNSTIRRQDGSYQFNSVGAARTVPPDITDKQLGEALLGLLDQCRA
ncbi:MAG: hypothetical protein N2484_13135 [Clostridia bacterium]|nr:hypothetical protein [Clostridia bacterium]